MTQTNAHPPYTIPGTIQLRPRTVQFFIDNWPLLTLDLCGYTCAGMDGMPFMGLLLWLSVAVSLVLAYRFIYLKRMVYELYRVVDFGERSNLLQQLCGLKTVSVYSGDRTTPRLDIIGVGINEKLVPIIRERVEQNKRRKGIYEITNR